MQLCENLREMDNFLLIVNYQNQPKKKMENFNRPITVEEIRRWLEVYQWKAPERDGLTAEFYLISNERIIPGLFELSGAIEKDRRETSLFILCT